MEVSKLLKGDRYQGDAKWPKKWEQDTREQVEAMKQDEQPEKE